MRNKLLFLLFILIGIAIYAGFLVWKSTSVPPRPIFKNYTDSQLNKSNLTTKNTELFTNSIIQPLFWEDLSTSLVLQYNSQKTAEGKISDQELIDKYKMSLLGFKVNSTNITLAQNEVIAAIFNQDWLKTFNEKYSLYFGKLLIKKTFQAGFTIKERKIFMQNIGDKISQIGNIFMLFSMDQDLSTTFLKMKDVVANVNDLQVQFGLAQNNGTSLDEQRFYKRKLTAFIQTRENLSDKIKLAMTADNITNFSIAEMTYFASTVSNLITENKTDSYTANLFGLTLVEFGKAIKSTPLNATLNN